jgi:hypothetical protein
MIHDFDEATGGDDALKERGLLLIACLAAAR